MFLITNNKTFKDVRTNNRMTGNKDDLKITVLLTRQVPRIPILK